jgi:hypothetical protein
MTDFLTPFWLKHAPLKKEPYHYLRFEKDTRYYELRLAKDLLNDWTLITSNGRIKSKLGQSRTQAFSTFHEAITQLYAAVTLRKKRQYQMTRYLVEDLIYILLLQHQLSHPVKKSTATNTKEKSTQTISNNKPIKHKLVNSQQTCFFF